MDDSVQWNVSELGTDLLGVGDTIDNLITHFNIATIDKVTIVSMTRKRLEAYTIMII